MNWTKTIRSAGWRLLVPMTLRLHWPEYLMELTEMGLYLLFTCVFATLFQHPTSPISHLLPNLIVRRACFGISVGATIVVIALTPWGKQSGGHLNPAMTFTFYRLGTVEFWDAILYGTAQFAGAIAGVVIATFILRGAPGNPTIRYAATLPGKYGTGVAFVAEVVISFTLMFTVLFAANHNLLSRYTAYFVGALYAIFITLETPLSGMSMNPARTLGSAFRGRYWHALWVISWPRLWVCWLRRSSFCECAAASALTAPNSTVPMTSAVFSATARSTFGRQQAIKQQLSHQELAPKLGLE